MIGLFSFSCIFPFLFVIIISLTDEQTLVLEGFRLLPSQFSTAAYEYIFKTGSELLSSFGLTLLVTVLGTLVSLALVTTYAYALSRRNFEFRGFFQLSGVLHHVVLGRHGTGLYRDDPVPASAEHDLGADLSAILERVLHHRHEDLFQTTIPDEIIESAKIDGAGEFLTFIRIVLPVSLPGSPPSACSAHWVIGTTGLTPCCIITIRRRRHRCSSCSCRSRRTWTS